MLGTPQINSENINQRYVKTIQTPEGTVEVSIALQQESATNRLKLNIEMGQLPLNDDVKADRYSYPIIIPQTKPRDVQEI